ncbi:MAG: exosortase C-terminal domain/associated protein EpsI [Gemmatimonadaceae bacterium]
MNAPGHYAPAALLMLGIGLVVSGRDQQAIGPAQPLGSLPRVIEGVAGQDHGLDDAEREAVGVSHYLLRNFGPASTPEFSVYVGYYARQIQGQTIHSPKNCLPGAGWQVLSSGTRAVPMAAGRGSERVNRYLVANGSVVALVYYWYQGRGRVASNEYLVKWDLLRDAMLTGRTEEALVRVVVPIAGGGDADRGEAEPPGSRGGAAANAAPSLAAADSLAIAVAAQIIPAMREVLPRPPG